MRLAARTSPLARRQAEVVAAALRRRSADRSSAAGPHTDTQLVTVTTSADRDLSTKISEMAGRGVFVTEVQHCVLEGRADAAVHSAKDMRPVPTDGLDYVGCLPRGDPRDALVGATLAGLGTGAVVATGSQRRRSLLHALRDDLRVVEMRGNMARRLAYAERDDIDAVIVAAAALDRLDLSHRIAQRLDTDVFVPQVGQGAIAVECRAADTAVRARLAAICDPTTTRCVAAERSFLAALGGGCTLPVGAYATIVFDDPHGPDNPVGVDNPAGPAGAVRLRVMLGSFDGRVVLRAEQTDIDAEALGARLAHHVLHDLGGSRLLADMHWTDNAGVS